MNTMLNLKIEENVIYNGIFYEQIIRYKDENIGILIAIHSTKRGPALGGCRLIHGYSEESALETVCRLAKAMTYKNVIADIHYGGGKCFIYHCPTSLRNDAFRILADILNNLDGRYFTADDIGTTVLDMEFLRQYTPYARGILYKGSQIPATSLGIKQVMRACAERLFDQDLAKLTVAIQGIGKVGYSLTSMLSEIGCTVYVNEIDKSKCEELHRSKSFVEIEEFIGADVDILCPCAFGNVITPANCHLIHATAIIGGANNQLSSDSVDALLWQQGIYYMPDYLCNCGGVIDIDCEGVQYSYEYVRKRLEYIYVLADSFLKEAMQTKTSVLSLTNRFVENVLLSE